MSAGAGSGSWLCHIGEVWTVRGRTPRDGGLSGLVWTYEGKPKVVFDFVIADGKIVEIELIADTARLDRLDLDIG
jgi:hypothetical protein